MPLLIERPPENVEADDICTICGRPKKSHTFGEIQICSKKIKDLEKSNK